MANAQLLETENLIRSLADELLKLKSAVQQHEETRANLSKIHESLEKIGASSQNLAENTRTFMTRLEQINIEKRLAELHQDDAMLIEGQARHAEFLNILDGKIKEETEKGLQELHEQTAVLKEEQRTQTESLDGKIKEETEKGLQELHEQTAVLKEEQRTQTERTIQKISEESSIMREEQARQAELMAQQHVQQSKMLNLTRILVMASLLAQIVTILILVLR